MAKPRFDKRGSIFGELHRLLPDRCFLTDIDTMILKCDNELWSEYRYYNGQIKTVAIIEIKHHKTPNSLNHLNPEYSLTKAKIELARKSGARFLIGFYNNGKMPIEFYEISTKTLTASKLGIIGYSQDRQNQRKLIKDFYDKINLIDFKENNPTFVKTNKGKIKRIDWNNDLFTPGECGMDEQLEFKEVT